MINDDYCNDFNIKDFGRGYRHKNNDTLCNGKNNYGNPIMIM